MSPETEADRRLREATEEKVAAKKAREISEDLLLACSGLPDVDLFEYELSVSLEKVSR